MRFQLFSPIIPQFLFEACRGCALHFKFRLNVFLQSSNLAQMEVTNQLQILLGEMLWTEIHRKSVKMTTSVPLELNIYQSHCRSRGLWSFSSSVAISKAETVVSPQTFVLKPQNHTKRKFSQDWTGLISLLLIRNGILFLKSKLFLTKPLQRLYHLQFQLCFHQEVLQFVNYLTGVLEVPKQITAPRGFRNTSVNTDSVLNSSLSMQERQNME